MKQIYSVYWLYWCKFIPKQPHDLDKIKSKELILNNFILRQLLAKLYFGLEYIYAEERVFISFIKPKFWSKNPYKIGYNILLLQNLFS